MRGYQRYQCLMRNYIARFSTDGSGKSPGDKFIIGVIQGRSLGKVLIIPFVLVLWTTSFGCRAVATKSPPLDACALALAPHSGNTAIDLEIIRLQDTARHSTDSSRALEQLGWAYVQKARTSFDQGFYRLAE